jgi:acyl-CoA thioesterase-2
MAIITYEDTLSCLAIEACGDGVYTAPNIPMPYRRIFGGQLLAQLVAVGECATAGKQIKSLHVAFAREGDLDEPVRFEVTKLHAGRTFASLNVHIQQDDRSVAGATLSLHVPESGALEHQSLVADSDTIEAATPMELSMIPWETRIVDAVDLEARTAGPPAFAFHMKTPPLDSGTVAHRALLAHATDLTVIGTALRPCDGLSEADSPDRLHTAVTSHSIWFHRSFAVDDWLRVEQTSPLIADARAFGRGDVFDVEGRLVASFAQESMIRSIS